MWKIATLVFVLLVQASGMQRDKAWPEGARRAHSSSGTDLRLRATMPIHQIVGITTHLDIAASTSRPIRHLVLEFEDVVARGGDAWDIHYERNATGICIGGDEPPPALVGKRHGGIFVDFGAVGPGRCKASVEIVPEKAGYQHLTIWAYASAALGKVTFQGTTQLRGASVRVAAWQTSHPWGTPPHPLQPGSLGLRLTGKLGRPSLSKPYLPLDVHVGYVNGWVPDLRLRYRGSRYLQPYPGQQGGTMCGIRGMPVGTDLYDNVYDYGPNPQRGGCNVELGLNVLRPGKYVIVLEAYAGAVKVRGAALRLSAKL